MTQCSGAARSVVTGVDQPGPTRMLAADVSPVQRRTFTETALELQPWTPVSTYHSLGALRPPRTTAGDTSECFGRSSTACGLVQATPSSEWVSWSTFRLSVTARLNRTRRSAC